MSKCGIKFPLIWYHLFRNQRKIERLRKFKKKLPYPQKCERHSTRNITQQFLCRDDQFLVVYYCRLLFSIVHRCLGHVGSQDVTFGHLHEGLFWSVVFLTPTTWYSPDGITISMRMICLNAVIVLQPKTIKHLLIFVKHKSHVTDMCLLKENYVWHMCIWLMELVFSWQWLVLCGTQLGLGREKASVLAWETTKPHLWK